MILRCLIVDDEPPAVRILQNYLCKLEGVSLVATAGNALEAYNILQKEKIDLIFLDINMPEISGLNLLKILKEPPAVILTTAYSEYALESYEYSVVDYLLKPIRFERFMAACEKARVARKQILSNVETTVPDFIEFRINGGLKKLPVNDILYFQSLGNYIKVFLLQRSYIILLTTKEAESTLPKGQFLRIHKSYIVNMSKVGEFSNEYVDVAGVKLPLGKTYKRYFLEQKGTDSSLK